MTKIEQTIVTSRCDLDAYLSKAQSVLTSLRGNDNFKTLGDKSISELLELASDQISKAKLTEAKLFESISDAISS